MPKRIIIAGAGFAGLTLALNLKRLGLEPEVFEKNSFAGGKTHRFTLHDFTFDMGAMLYLFPKVIQRVFSNFNRQTDDYYRVQSLNPSCRHFFGEKDFFDIDGNSENSEALFARLEKNGKSKFHQYITKAQDITRVILSQKLSNENITLQHLTTKSSGILQNSHANYVNRLIINPKLRSVLEFPLPYLNMGSHHPQLAFLLNYQLLTHPLKHPLGGMSKLTDAFVAMLEDLQVPLHLDSPMQSFDIINDHVSGMLTHQKNFHADVFASTMDYQYTDRLLPDHYRNYSQKFWEKRSRNSSVLIFFLGVNTVLPNLVHHNLIFEEFFENPDTQKISANSGRIMHVCCPSKTNKCAPEGMENVVIRLKVPPGVEDTGKMRELYYKQSLDRLSQITGINLHDKIVCKKSYAMTDFESEYNSYRGTFDQSHLFTGGPFSRKLKLRNKYLSNLYYGELPGYLGPGIASSVLNGEVLANKIYKDLFNKAQ